MLKPEQLERKIAERPSSMDRALICAASLYPSEGEPLIETVGDDAAPIGQAAHEVFKAIAMDEDYNLEELALKHGIKTSDLDYLKYTAYKSMEVLNEQFDVEKWVAEERQISLSVKGLDIQLEGTPDLSGVTKDGTTLVVVDYKTGRSTASHKNQIMSYGYILLNREAPNMSTPENVAQAIKGQRIEKVIGVIAWARDLEFQVWNWTREELDVWAREANEIIYGWDGVSYTVGEHCTFCRRATACDARLRELKYGYDLLTTGTELGLTPELLNRAYEASKSLPKLIEDWRQRLKEQIKATGDFDMGDGKVLTLKERNGASVIDTKKATEVLNDFDFSLDNFLGCCKVSKSAIETVVGDRADKGMKGRDKKAVIEALKEAGALTQPINHVLAVVDAPVGQLTEGGK